MRRFANVLAVLAALPIGFWLLDWAYMIATHPGAEYGLLYRGSNNCMHNLPIVADRIKTKLNENPATDIKTLLGRSYECGGHLGDNVCRTPERNGLSQFKLWYLHAQKVDDRWRVRWLCDTLVKSLDFSPQTGKWQLTPDRALTP